MKIWKALFVIALVAPVAYRLCAGGPKRVTPAGKQIVRYMAWGYPSQLNTDRDLITAFNASQKDIEVQFIMAPMQSYFDKVQLMLATGTAADVTRVNPEHFRAYIGLGYFVDLEPFMQSDPEYNPDEFFQVARDVALYKGRHYGVPVLFGKGIVYYNKTLFEKAGVEDPWQRFEANRWHWEDYLDAAKALTKIDEQGNGIMGTSFLGDWAGRWTYLVKYKAIFHVQARDLTAEELRALQVEARLQQLEEKLEAVRGQVQLLCEQLDWRGPGCP